MDTELLRQTVEQSRYAAVGVAFLAGLFFSVNPVAIAAIPVSLAYVTTGPESGLPHSDSPPCSSLVCS